MEFIICDMHHICYLFLISFKVNKFNGMGRYLIGFM